MNLLQVIKVRMKGGIRKVYGKDADGEEAATGPGATGKLPGATESARQEP